MLNGHQAPPSTLPFDLPTNQGSNLNSKDRDSLDYNNTTLSFHRVYKTKCLIQDFDNKTLFDGSMLLEGPKYKWIPGNSPSILHLKYKFFPLDLRYSAQFLLEFKHKKSCFIIKELENVKYRYPEE
jgi:antitoxin component YwqK of YwqJK toxin-antitoxin module